MKIKEISYDVDGLAVLVKYEIDRAYAFYTLPFTLPNGRPVSGFCPRAKLEKRVKAAIKKCLTDERQKGEPQAIVDSERALVADQARRELLKSPKPRKGKSGRNEQEKIYSRETIIAELIFLFLRLWRTPSSSDINRAHLKWGCVSLPTVILAFGSLTAAQKAAGLTPIHLIIYSPEELISQLKKMKEDLGRAPDTHDLVQMSKEGKGASLRAFYRCFGSLSIAKEIAGVSSPRITVPRITVEGAKEKLQKLASELGRTPTYCDIDNAHIQGKDIPCTRTYFRLFESLTKAQKEAGLELNKIRRGKIPYSDNYLLDLLRGLSKDGEALSSKEIQEAASRGDCLSTTTFWARFGTLAKAVEAAGLKYTGRRIITDIQLLDRLRGLGEECLSPKKIIKAFKTGKCSSPATYKKHFGSLEKAVELAELEYTRWER
ncbi:MAG: hypothetical protein WCW77_03335 [Patescibacteria group bacterium]|jgi:hypothetical protein